MSGEASHQTAPLSDEVLVGVQYYNCGPANLLSGAQIQPVIASDGLRGFRCEDN